MKNPNEYARSSVISHMRVRLDVHGRMEGYLLSSLQVLGEDVAGVDAPMGQETLPYEHAVHVVIVRWGVTREFLGGLAFIQTEL